MSDIVERLRSRFNEALRMGDSHGELLSSEAADEIERLRSDVDFHLNTVGRLTTDIQRLRGQCDGLAQAALNNGQDLLLKEREIERLRAHERALAEDILTLEAEIERLCDRNALLEAAHLAMESEIERLIERATGWPPERALKP